MAPTLVYYLSLLLILSCNAQSNGWIYDLSPREAADLVKSEFRHGYEAYKNYSWGFDELKPLTFDGSNWSENSMMITPIDSLGTMAIMGLQDLIDMTLDELLCDGSEPKFSFLMDQSINMFEIVIRDLGGLVSAYHFLQNKAHKQCIKKLAIELGDGIYETTFNGKNNVANIADLPWIHINIATQTVNWMDINIAPAGLASNIIEFGALSYIADDAKYYIAAKKTMRKIYDLRSRETGLVGAALNVMTRDVNNFTELWPDNSAHVDAQIDSYYEYMIKCYLLFKDEECLRWWNEAIDSIYEYLQYRDEADNVWFQRVDWNNGTVFGNDSRHFSYRYSLHAHFMAAALALDEDLDIEMAIKNQEANHLMWSIEGLTPFMYDFDEEVIISPQYDLNPEIFESNYYLYVKTKDILYLNRTYEYLDALLTYTKCVDNIECAGYSAIENVTAKERKNLCPSFWFAESLKFLYLTFMSAAPDNTFNFDEYIFTTEAHPIPRGWGKNAYLWTEASAVTAEDIWAFINLYIFSVITMLICLYMTVLIFCTKLTKRSRYVVDFQQLEGTDPDSTEVDNFENDKIDDTEFKASYYSALYSFFAMLFLFLSSGVILFIQTNAVIDWSFDRYGNEELDYLKWSWFMMVSLYLLGKVFIFFTFSFLVTSRTSNKFLLRWSRIFIVAAVITALIVQIILNDEFIDKDIIHTNGDILTRRIRGITVSEPTDAIFSVILVLLFSMHIVLIYLRRFKELKAIALATKQEQQHKQTDLIERKNSVKMYLIVKDWLLLCVFTVSSWICMILWLIDLKPARINGFFLPCTDLMISAICLFFLYYFHERAYQKCCKYCHVSCVKCIGIQPDNRTFNQIQRMAKKNVDIRSDPMGITVLDDDLQHYGITDT